MHLYLNCIGNNYKNSTQSLFRYMFITQVSSGLAKGPCEGWYLQGIACVAEVDLSPISLFLTVPGV